MSPEQTECPECDGTGEVWESCHCYQCEYADSHGGLVPCLECGGTGRRDQLIGIVGGRCK